MHKIVFIDYGQFKTIKILLLSFFKTIFAKMAEDILFILNSRKKEKLCSALIDNISGPGDKKRENMSKLPAADRKPKFQCDGQRM